MLHESECESHFFPHKAKPDFSVHTDTGTFNWIKCAWEFCWRCTHLVMPQLCFLLTVVPGESKICTKKRAERYRITADPWPLWVGALQPLHMLIQLPSQPLFHLILPEEFNLLPRVPSHNFFKSTFYETAIPFHRGPCTVNPICKASYAVTLTWQKCRSAVLCFALAHIIACWGIL